MKPPIAKQQPKVLETHGHQRQDPYFWLNERENPEVIDYLKAENAYKEEVLAPTKNFQGTLFEEMKGRIKQDDSSVPYRKDDYFYYSRYETGKEYPIYCRKKGALTADEEIILDVNILAEGKEYCAVAGGTNVSDDHRYLAYSTDYVSRRIYTLNVRDLTTGEDLADQIPGITGNVVWSKDNRTLFYSKQDPQTLRSYQIYRHTLGADASDDVLVFQEDDDTYRCYVTRTKSRKYLVIQAASTLSDEVHILEADKPYDEFRLFAPRERELEYSIDHAGDHFYIHTNLDAKNFCLMRCSEAATTKENWETVIPHRTDVLLENIELFKDFLVLDERKNGLHHLRIMPWEGEEHYLEFQEATYSAGIGYNPEYDTKVLRYHYDSMTTPSSIYDYDMVGRTQTLMKQQEILGGFEVGNYRSQRVFATADDGTKVPMSLVHHRDTPLDGRAPLLLYGYGSYGYSIDPYFSSSRLSLLNRGFIYVIAHIRGGEEMGRQWYDDGKMLNKKNTFTDFIACGEHLVKEGYTSAGKLFAMGGSAGGLLMGAIINMRPDLWAGIVAAVPFVDVVTTMLDDSIPLTTGEYDEWGNPNVKEYYDYILSYSPYDNIEPKAYPPMLVTTGIHDSQVQYWEPAKWVAKLRVTKTDDHPLLLHTNLETGHGGASGRFEALKEVAMEYAFLLWLAEGK